MSAYPQQDDGLPNFEPRIANEAYARKKASELGLDPDRFAAQLRTESGFSSNAFNKGTKAQGIAQYIPGTAKLRPGFDPSDAKASIDAAAEDKRAFTDRFGNERAAESAHFNGPGNAIAALRNKQGNPKTHAYVSGIDKATGQTAAEYDDLPDFTVSPPQTDAAFDKSVFSERPRPRPRGQGFNIAAGFDRTMPQRISDSAAARKPAEPQPTEFQRAFRERRARLELNRSPQVEELRRIAQQPQKAQTGEPDPLYPGEAPALPPQRSQSVTGGRPALRLGEKPPRPMWESEGKTQEQFEQEAGRKARYIFGPEELGRGAVRGFGRSVGGVVEGTGRAVQVVGQAYGLKPVDRIGQSIAETGDSIKRSIVNSVADPQGESLGGQAGEALGSGGVFAIGGAGAALVKLPGWAVAAYAGITSQMSEAYDQARAHGQNHQQALHTAILFAPIGLSEIEGIGVGPARSFKRAFTESLMQAGKREFRQEAGQEFGQSLANDFATRLLIDPEHEISPRRAITSAGLGGVAGAVYGGAGHIGGAAYNKVQERITTAAQRATAAAENQNAADAAASIVDLMSRIGEENVSQTGELQAVRKAGERQQRTEYERQRAAEEELGDRIPALTVEEAGQRQVTPRLYGQQERQAYEAQRVKEETERPEGNLAELPTLRKKDQRVTAGETGASPAVDGRAVEATDPAQAGRRLTALPISKEDEIDAAVRRAVGEQGTNVDSLPMRRLHQKYPWEDLSASIQRVTDHHRRLGTNRYTLKPAPTEGEGGDQLPDFTVQPATAHRTPPGFTASQDESGNTIFTANPREKRGGRGEEEMTLSQFVRSLGGFKDDADLRGELKRLKEKGGGSTTGLVTKNGLSPDRMLEAAIEAGFIHPDDDLAQNPGNFVYAVENDANGRDVRRHPEAINREMGEDEGDTSFDFGANVRVRDDAYNQGEAGDSRSIEGVERRRAPAVPPGPRRAGEVLSTKPDATLSNARRRTYDEVQHDIDRVETELEKQGIDPVKLFNPNDGTKKEHLPAGYEAMPQKLAGLYGERDAIGAGELEQSVGDLQKRVVSVGLSSEEADTVLRGYSLGSGRGAADQYMASEHTVRSAQRPIRSQVEEAYIALAAKRGIPMDNLDDVFRDRQTTRDAAAAVRAVVTYFTGETPTMPKGLLEPTKAERRVNTAERRRVDQMSPEEMKRELLTSSVTELPNKRAYDEAPKRAIQVRSDIDGLKAINDHLGHDAGDELLRAKAQALRDEGVEAYHASGDEFYAQFDDSGEASAAMERVAQRLRGATIEATTPDGRTLRYEGPGFSYGIGSTPEGAESDLQRDKSAREQRGERAPRGEKPRGLGEVTPQGKQDQGKSPAEEVEPEFSSTQVNLPAKTAKLITDLAAKIPDEALAEDGREENPHITVKYGLHDNDAENLTKVLADEGPIKLKLGRTSQFKATKDADYDVVKIDVDSPDLHRLNKKIADAVQHTDTHPTYKPHVTLAYVKPGEGKNYVDDNSLEDHEITLDSIVFSGKDRSVTDIPLRGNQNDTNLIPKSGTTPKTETPQAVANPELNVDKEADKKPVKKGASEADLEGLIDELMGDEPDNKPAPEAQRAPESSVEPAAVESESTIQRGGVAQSQASKSELGRPDLHELAKSFAAHFAKGETFKSILAARAHAAKFLNQTIKPGTALAKQVDEAVEMGLVIRAREIVADETIGGTDQAAYKALVGLYNDQPNLGVKSSTSVRDQAYSTPVPIAFVASRLARITQQSKVYEPTAGNGALLIEVQPKNIVANELNPERAAALKASLPGAMITQADATRATLPPGIDVVLANPPFGPVKENGENKRFTITNQYTTSEIDHAISFKALEAMPDGGRAVLIVASAYPYRSGDWTNPELRSEEYNSKAKRGFYYELYKAYNVTDHFTVDGKLYTRQGAGWPVDMIVIDGRGKSKLTLPAADVPRIYSSYEELGEVLNASRAEEIDRMGAAARPGTEHAEPEPGSTPDSRSDRGTQGDEADAATLFGPLERPAAEDDRGSAGSRGGETRTLSGSRKPRTRGSRTDAGERGSRPGGEPEGSVDQPEGLQQPSSAPDSRRESGSSEVSGDRPRAVDHRADLGNRSSEVTSQDARKKERAALIAKLKAASPTKPTDQVRESKLPYGEEAKVAPDRERVTLMVQLLKSYIEDGTTDFDDAARQFQEDYGAGARELDAHLESAWEKLGKFYDEITPAGKVATVLSRPKVKPTDSQDPYQPASKKGTAIGTLVPKQMATATQQALKDLEAKVGPVDEFVASEIGAFTPEQFSAEQVDGIGMALDNMNSGTGFITGDQTGIGKGRIIAAIIKHAIKNRRIPIFVTEKPNLYADIYRDLRDIGLRDIRPLMTNASLTLALDRDETVFLKSGSAGAHNAKLRSMIDNESLGDHNMIFTTYSQMQTLEGQETTRRAFLEHFGRDAVIIFDESHNAGGAEKGPQSRGPRNAVPDRAALARQMVKNALSVLYSSATYAKRPSVMDLYSATDMKIAAPGPGELATAISKGGVPLQQIVASMLAKARQYLRRERSWDGINYNTVPAPVDHVAAESVSAGMRAIQDFDVWANAAVHQMNEEAKAAGNKAQTKDVGKIGTTIFTSVVHNLIDQMLLQLKMDATIKEAIASLERGEKPIITVANTMGSFIAHHAEENDLRPGDGIDLNFGHMLKRYLEKAREYTVKGPHNTTTRHYLTDEQLGRAGVAAYKRAKEQIDRGDWSGMPASPIDYLKSELAKKGYKIGEITGRTHTIDYTPEGAVYKLRSAKEIGPRGRNRTINAFNDGELHALIVNQAGATGVSLHAGEKFKDQRPRHMIITQAEKNIDTHMQLLGRINRTGQVVLPSYAQLVADIPAEKRPAAVLQKKMASLNANTTGAAGGKMTAKDVPDFMNQYGDEIIAEIMYDNPDIHAKLGRPLKDNPAGTGFDREGAARKATGRIPLLPIKEQEELYAQIESEYHDHIEQLNAMGENALEAKLLDLDAKPVSSYRMFEGPGGTSPFAEDANAEMMDVKRLGKPYTSEEVLHQIARSLNTAARTAPADQSDYPQLRVNGRAQAAELMKEVEDRFKVYRTGVVDDIGDADRAHAMANKLNIVHEKLSMLFRNLPVGQPVELHTVDSIDPYYGIVTKVEQKGKPKNPVALSSWKFHIAVADSARVFKINANKLVSVRDPESNTQIRYAQAERVTSLLSQSKVLDYFDESQTQSREQRTIVTGNLLGGFAAIPKGQIISFKDAAGDVRQGIMMPRGFDAKQAMEDRPVVFTSAAHVIQFLNQENGIVTTNDGELRVAMQNGDFRITAPAARSRGGQYYLNENILAAAGKDFVKSGSLMQIVVIKPVAERVLKAAIGEGYAFQTTSFKPEARKIIGDQANTVREDHTAYGKSFDEWKTERGRRNNPQTATPEFKRWFGESKVLTKQLSLFERKRKYATRPGADRQLSFDFAAAGLRAVEDAASRVSSATGKVVSAQPRGGQRGRDAGSGVRTLGVGITSELVNKGRVDLRGQRAKTAEDVARLAQIFRDPRFETLRIIYTKGDTIVGQEGLTSRMPGAARGFLGNDEGKAFQKMRMRMARLNADGYYLLHNHPSGRANPSFEDVQMSRAYENGRKGSEGLRPLTGVPGFKGHVVIDSGEYGVISPGLISREGRPQSNVEIHKFETTGTDKLLTPSIEHPLIGELVNNAAEIADLGKALQTPDEYVAVIHRGADGRVRAIQEMPRALLTRIDQAADYLRGQRRAFGAVESIVYSAKTDPYIQTAGERLFESGAVLDFIAAEPRGLGPISVKKAGRVRPGHEQTPPAIRVEEPHESTHHSHLQPRTEEGRFDGPPETAAKQTDTPEFKRWFGESKVTDDKGEPLVMYHGTHRDFATFDRLFAHEITRNKPKNTIDEVGLWFTDTPANARLYGPKTVQAFLRVEKPFKIYEQGSKGHAWSTLEKLVQREGGAAQLRADLLARGYDGVMLVDASIDGAKQNVTIPFEPTQIKSATGNRGTFDPDDANIVREDTAAYGEPPDLRSRISKIFDDAERAAGLKPEAEVGDGGRTDRSAGYADPRGVDPQASSRSAGYADPRGVDLQASRGRKPSPTSASKENDKYLAALLGAMDSANTSKPKGKTEPPILGTLKNKIGVLYTDAIEQGLSGDDLVEHVRRGLIELVDEGPEFAESTPGRKREALRRLQSADVKRWIDWFGRAQKKQEMAAEVMREEQRVADERNWRLISHEMDEGEQRQIIKKAEAFRKEARDDQGRLLSGFLSRVATHAKSYGKAGGELVNRLTDGDIDRSHIIETGSHWLNEINKIYGEIKNPFDKHALNEEVITALEDRQNAEDHLTTDAGRAVYEQAVEMLDHFKAELSAKGYEVLEDYFTHMRDVDVMDQLFGEVKDPREIEARSLNQLISEKSPYLKHREGADLKIKRDVPAVLWGYLKSVSKELAYKDAVEYYYTRFQHDIPLALRRNSLDRAMETMRNSLASEKGSGKAYQVANFVRKQLYRSFLGFNLKASLQNFTQVEFAKMRWTPEANKLRKQIARNKQLITGPLQDAIDLASRETPRFLEMFKQEAPSREGKIERAFNRADPFQRSEARNWKATELGSIINSVVKRNDWKQTLADAGGDVVKAINEILADKKAFDAAVREAAVTAGHTQVASSPAMRGEIYDSPAARLLLMFTAFKARQLQVLGQTLGRQQGINGSRSQAILQRGLTEDAQPVEVLRDVETTRKSVEELINQAKRHKQDLGVPIHAVQEYANYLKSQEAELNDAIAEMEPLGGGSGRRALVVGRYMGIVAAVSIVNKLLWNWISDAGDDKEKTEEEKDARFWRDTRSVIFDISPIPMYNFNPSDATVTPVLPRLHFMQYGKFSAKAGMKDLTEYGVRMVPYAGVVNRASGNRISKGIVDMAMPKAEERIGGKTPYGPQTYP